MNRHAIVLSATAVALTGLLAGCGGDDDGRVATTAGGTSSATSPAPSAASTPAPAEGIDPLAGAGTEPQTQAATNSETALLTAVRVARHEGYDRIVFQFRNAVPGYDVRYVPRPVTQDGSGEAVSVDGAFVARIRMENALDADLSKASAPPTYTGPARIVPTTPEVAELVRVGGFEGVLTWVAGLRDRVDVRVTTLSDPPRLVVDFRNH